MSRARGGAFAAFQKTVKIDQTPATSSSSSPGGHPEAPRAWRRAARSPKELTVEETKALLESLRTAVNTREFKQSLENLQSRGWGAFKKREAVARLLGSVWKRPTKDAGFSIDEFGFPQLLSAVRKKFDQPGIRTLSEEVERQIRFHPGSLFSSKAGEMKGAVRSEIPAKPQDDEGNVQVIVRHPTDRDEVAVTVSSQASMRQVKDAVAKQLQRPEILQTGRFVVNGQTGDLMPIPDSQKLGEKRSLLMIGVSLAAAPAEVPAPPITRDRQVNLGEAKELLKAFREIASSKDVQKTIANIHKQGQQAVVSMKPRL